MLGSQTRERRLELERFLDRLVHEVLDDLLAPRPERAAAESAAEAANAGEADAAKLPRVAVEHVDADVGEDPRDLAFLSGLEVVIPEHGDDGDFRRREILREDARLFGQAVVGEIAAQHQHVGRLGDLAEQRLKASLRGLRVVDVAQRGEADDVGLDAHASLDREGIGPRRSLALAVGELAGARCRRAPASPRFALCILSRSMAYQSTLDHPGRDTNAFYRRTLHVLSDAQVPFLVGGSHALLNYTGIVRETKDFDLFVRRTDLDAALEALRQAGLSAPRSRSRTGSRKPGRETTSSISCSARATASAASTTNGSPTRTEADVLGMPVKIAPVEELLWQKTFVMERERYDGADVAHIIRSCAETLDWDRVMRRFDAHWQLLLSYLILFGFIYPSERHRIPERVMNELTARLQTEISGPPSEDRVCRGTLTSRAQYLLDIGRYGYEDARLQPRGQHDARGRRLLDLGDRTRAVTIQTPRAPALSNPQFEPRPTMRAPSALKHAFPLSALFTALTLSVAERTDRKPHAQPAIASRSTTSPARLRVQAGSGSSVVVQVTRGGRDGGQLSLQSGDVRGASTRFA